MFVISFNLEEKKELLELLKGNEKWFKKISDSVGFYMGEYQPPSFPRELSGYNPNAIYYTD